MGVADETFPHKTLRKAAGWGGGGSLGIIQSSISQRATCLRMPGGGGGVLPRNADSRTLALKTLMQ